MNISIGEQPIVTFFVETHCMYQNGNWRAIETNIATKCFHVSFTCRKYMVKVIVYVKSDNSNSV